MTVFSVLDLCCGAGGASVGYAQAGFDYVTGVDIVHQKHHPAYRIDLNGFFKNTHTTRYTTCFNFIQADTLDFLDTFGPWITQNFDLIHASPPCQGYSILNVLHRDRVYPDLIAPIRQRLVALGLPYVIENVVGAREALEQPVLLCGTMFGAQLFRHRLFEIGQGLQKIQIDVPEHVEHAELGLSSPKTSRKPDYDKGEVHSIYGHFSDVARARAVMGIDWMSRDELAQAIPPVYCKWIGTQLINQVLHAQIGRDHDIPAYARHNRRHRAL